MNLHAIASKSISGVNPMVDAQVMRSGGSITAPSGKRTPVFDLVVNVRVQVQSLTYMDLMQLNGLNIQGVRRAVYMSGEVQSVVRVNKDGGDIFVFGFGVIPEGTTWLAAHVLETWPDWRKVVITLQNPLGS